MTDEALARLLELRLQDAEKIRQNPRAFKVCGQCRSISCLPARTCSVCGAYRWHCSEHVVRLTMMSLVGNVVPHTLGYIPR